MFFLLQGTQCEHPLQQARCLFIVHCKERGPDTLQSTSNGRTTLWPLVVGAIRCKRQYDTEPSRLLLIACANAESIEIGSDMPKM